MRVLLRIGSSVGLVVFLASGFLFADPEDPFCNFLKGGVPKYCKDPYTKCEIYDRAPPQSPPDWACPPVFDDSKIVIPNCVGGDCNSYCFSNGTILCTQERKCKKKPLVNECEDNGAAGPPSYTTFYGSVPCQDVCE